VIPLKGLVGRMGIFFFIVPNVKEVEELKTKTYYSKKCLVD